MLFLEEEEAVLSAIASWLGEVIEHKKMEEKVKEVMEVKSEFISTVSHELRTPLTSIKEGVSIILDGILGKVSDEQKDFLNVVKKNADRLARLIDNVLDFQKLEAGKVKFEMNENNMNEVVKESCRAMSTMVDGKGLKCTFKPDDKLPMVKFDRDKILQVLTNFLSNAIKFTDKGGITVTTSREAGNVIRVSVKDTGSGIKKTDLPKLFKRFEQLGRGGSKKTGGTGLGLAISREIIEYHKGRIWAESEPGKGATFFFELPIGK
jgi:signal transduction histidine kinase